MSGCLLRQIGIPALLAGAVPEAQARQLLEHLESDCPDCAEVMAAAGLDEQALLLVLVAPPAPADVEARVSALWHRSREAIASPADRSWFGRRWPRLVLPVAGLAAAAALVIALRLAAPTDGTAEQRLKGSAPPANATLAVGAPPAARYVDGATVALHYGLERAGWLRLLHWRPTGRPTTLFDGRADAASPGQGVFGTEAGALGYRFEREPGAHLFVLISSDRRLTETQAASLLDAAWFRQPVPWHMLESQGLQVGVRMELVHVE
ncbi:MAG: zf-HC2 domain-containing protein [Deltaproteobacteria bacterium]|nr:zf-HC2 domain-containing protein [Deltaproteobacteria bacterium]